MKLGVVNKLTTVNRFVLHTLQRNITLLAVITRITNIILGILKMGQGLEKSHIFTCIFSCYYCSIALKRQSEYSRLRPDTNSLVRYLYYERADDAAKLSIS